MKNKAILGIPEKISVFQLHQTSEFADLHYDNQRNSFEIVTVGVVTIGASGLPVAT